MNHSFHPQNVSPSDYQSFVPIRQHTNIFHDQNIITLQNNPEFGLTFGRPQAQLINHLFETPNTKIHSKNTPHKPQRNNTIQTSVRLRSRAQSALHRKFLSKQLDLDKLRQNMSRITYSIKTIECRNEEEIGISSRRVIMGNKLLETQKNFMKIKFNTNRSRCSSSSNRFEFGDENFPEQSQYQSQKPTKENQIISHNKFASKRLNVIVKKKKSNFPKELENSFNSINHFLFESNQEQSYQTEQNPETINYDSINTEGSNKITFRQMKQNRPATIQNKRLKYETLMAKKSSQKIHQKEECKFGTNLTNKIPFGQKILLANQGQLLSQRKRKVSLSNILSQYHTQIIENSNNVLIERSNLCQPLKELFKNKFSTISKTVHDEGKDMLEKNLLKIKMRRNRLAKKQSNNEEGSQNGRRSQKKFKKYEQIQKQNACLFD